MATVTWTETSLTNTTAWVSSGLSTTIARNAGAATTFNASSKFAMRALINASRTGTTALTNGVDIIIRPETAVSSAGISVHGESFHVRTQSAAAQSTTISGSNVSAGATTLNVASTTSWAAGDWALVGAGTAREEWVRVGRVTSSTALLIDEPCQYAHTTAQADTVINKTDAYATAILDGGCIYDFIADYGDDSAGDTYRIWGIVQTLDSIA